ncbi:uncharacterized protein LOC110240299 [Exaiptasia diaphana]|uniref:Uncharacterized protein n=1 Tax=Exaiptasia diaphana TaxID=2652724 RepID=A0A913XB40_EXADI|nr:uncharacterized protein LOC110240299 [Exaiptasia diaphana]
MDSSNPNQSEVLPILSSFRDPLKPIEKAKRPIVRCGVFPRASSRNDAYLKGKTVCLWFQVDTILASILWTLLNKSDTFSLNFTLWLFSNWKREKKILGYSSCLCSFEHQEKYFRLLHSDVKSKSHRFLKLNIKFELLYGAFSIESDIKWCKRLQPLVIECMLLSDLMSWLSTLGGAYSSLGEQSPICSEKAGHISKHQLFIAGRLNNPVLVAQCQVFMAMSLVQRGHLKTAIKIIRKQYALASNGMHDQKLIASCKAVWNRIRYLKQSKVRLKNSNTSLNKRT